MVEQGRYYGTGKRKTAVARVYLKTGSGLITVNGKPVDSYFSREVCKMVVKQPLELLHLTSKYDVVTKVHGGGDSSQAGAIRLGIARALNACDLADPIVLDADVVAAAKNSATSAAVVAPVEEAGDSAQMTDDELLAAAVAAEAAKEKADEFEGSVVHKLLRRAGLLTRDARKVERKKVGLHKARKATQYSKR